jgi:hypothetical protein
MLAASSRAGRPAAAASTSGRAATSARAPAPAAAAPPLPRQARAVAAALRAPARRRRGVSAFAPARAEIGGEYVEKVRTRNAKTTRPPGCFARVVRLCALLTCLGRGAQYEDIDATLLNYLTFKARARQRRLLVCKLCCACVCRGLTERRCRLFVCVPSARRCA